MVWAQSQTSLIKELGKNLSSGLSKDQVRSARLQFGKNVLISKKSAGRATILLRQFKTPMSLTLLVATILSFSFGEILNAIAILAIVILNVSIAYFQESKANTAILALRTLSVPRARVLREGQIHTIKSADIVPGDILQIEAGDYIVADARLFEASQLTANESTLTGESLPVGKKTGDLKEETILAERSNMLFGGTAISSGSGKAVVTAIGMQTEIGQIANLLNTTKETSTPLQIRLEKVSYKLLLICGILILIVAAIGILHNQDWFTIFMTAISLAVAAIPEGLPTIVSLALTLAVRRMTKRNALIRNMSAVETLGSTDIICTDKTGTLTTGEMRVREIFTLENKLILSENFKGTELIYQALILCNNASSENGGSGDTTELALLSLAEDHKVEVRKIRSESPRLYEWSFESIRKRMSVAVKNNGKIRIFCKGAPEALMPLCQLSLQQNTELEKTVLELSKKGRRILALAWKESTEQNFSHLSEVEVENHFEFLGLISIADPPKEDAVRAIRDCKTAGIKVVMMTGDHPVTAEAIAYEVGICEKGVSGHVMTGDLLNSLSKHELKIKVEKTTVFARVSPAHKLKIIEALQSNGHIVAMTGDGVNDAPALKRASIGVSMGKGGTEVARQASAMVLIDDNLSTILAAIEEGRAIFGNIKRTIQYLLSTNLAEMLIVLGSVSIGLPMPLNPISLLWLNLVTDGPPSLALAAEPVAKDFLQTSLGPSPDSFFDKKFMRELYIVAFLMIVISLSVYYLALKTSDPITGRSYVFNLLVYLCLFRSFSCRSENKTYFELAINPWHLASVLVPIGLQIGLSYFLFFQKIFQVRTISIGENGILLLLAMIPVTLVELIKILKRKRKRTLTTKDLLH